MVGTQLHTLSVTMEFVPVLEKLSRIIEVHRGGARGTWKAHDPGFTPEGHCGALVIAFVRHLLWRWQMVRDNESLNQFAAGLRRDFADHIEDPCCRPYLAGLGLSVSARLADLLIAHGVPVSESSVRAMSVLKALGEADVGAALDSGNPWRELKWLGNQVRPPFMLIKPSELQAQIEKRGVDAPVGSKKHKRAKPSKGGGKGTVKPAVCLDPTLLRLESGIFQSEDGTPLSQLSLPQVGSASSGVAVVSVSVIDPYLKAAHPLSADPLALFVVDSPMVPVTACPVSSERVPLVCAANSEPLLIDGHLIQLGAVPVCRVPLQPSCDVKAIPTCVVKAMVFKDQTKGSWADVVSHPLLHIFAMVPPLSQCQDADCCGCECWHRSLDFPLDTPVLELWGKQWLRLDFSTASPDAADMFTCHIRLPEHLQMVVQQFSGHNGVYLEPKSLDGRKPSPAFQVVWLPKLEVSQLILMRQTVAHVIGLARLGTKMGLRCRSEHAAEVFGVLKPGHTFLPPGKRQSYLVGPFAYGTLQASVAQVLQANGWVAKPIQVVAAKAHVQGLMYRVQSVQEPPMKMLRLSHGDVLIAREDENAVPVDNAPKVLATSQTESFVSKAAEGDYIQTHDPWAKAAARLPAKSFQIGNPLEDITQKVVAEVMAKIPQPAMEVDSEQSTEKRVEALELQLKDLAGQTQSLAHQAQQQALDTSGQIQDLRGQLHQQSTHFEAAITAQANALQGFQDTFQEQFRQQVNHQQTMLDSMFSKQMSQFESLLSKRHRPE